MKIALQKGETIIHKARTWYGMPVEIIVAENHFHRVKFLGISMPHPGLVNLISRTGLPVKTQLELTALHEMGHFQTIPLSNLHMLLLFWPLRKNSPYPGWFRVLIGALTNHLVWEIASESYVIVKNRRAILTPRYPIEKALYVVFWTGMMVVVILGTRILYSKNIGEEK